MRFASFSEMLSWENEFSQDLLDVIKIDDDIKFHMAERLASGQEGVVAAMRGLVPWTG